MSGTGERLKEERKRVKHNQEVLSDALGITSRTLRRYEQGDSELDMHVMQKLASLGYDTLYIMSGQRADAPVTETLTRREVQLLDVFRELNEENQEQVMVIMDAMLHRQYFPLRQGGGPSGAAEGSDE